MENKEKSEDLKKKVLTGSLTEALEALKKLREIDPEEFKNCKDAIKKGNSRSLEFCHLLFEGMSFL